MAGKGPLPKPAEQRARRNATTAVAGLRIVDSDPMPQPPLPETMPGNVEWPVQTIAWWAMWGEDPLSHDFRSTDWSELLDTAVVHGNFWRGNIALAGELRQRTAAFGATQEARARLRIQYAQADEAEEKRRSSKPAADFRGAYKGLAAS